MGNAEADAIDALTNLTSSPSIPHRHVDSNFIDASQVGITESKDGITQSLFAAVAAAALSGQLQQQTAHPDTSSPPTIYQIQAGLSTVMDLVETFQSKHSLELLAQIMDAVSTHCEVLGLSPDESALTENEKLIFWRQLNEAWLYTIQRSAQRSSVLPAESTNPTTATDVSNMMATSQLASKKAAKQEDGLAESATSVMQNTGAPYFTDALSAQHIIEEDWIALRDSVMAWGDVLEWYGLVDYEMGFWEEKILNAIHLQIHQLRLQSASTSD